MPHDPQTSNAPHALIIRTAGTNCDRELAHAFELAGATTETIHLNTLIQTPAIFDRFNLIGIPGGFSYGDDIAAGRIFAMLIRENLYPALQNCIKRNVPIIAPCNGFQVLVQLGLLPGCLTTTTTTNNNKNKTNIINDQPLDQTVTLAPNVAGRFIDNWLSIEIENTSPCIWTKKIKTEAPADTLVLPIAHGEGRFVAEKHILDAIEENNLVALRYAPDSNVNGSMNRIAGISDKTGLIFGLMPHPERYTRWTHHPCWTRLDKSLTQTEIPFGLQIFQNAVNYAQNNVLINC